MRGNGEHRDYDVPEPSTYNGTTATVVDGGRNTKAVYWSCY